MAYTIHQRKEIAKKYFNFVGISIGDGLIDPINQMDFDQLLYQIGLIDANEKAKMKLLQGEITDLINKQEWIKVFDKVNYIQ